MGKAIVETADENMDLESISVDLNEQARDILEKAQAKGVEHSFLFVTTFRRYLEHLKHLEDLQKQIIEDGVTVKKEYVKGRKNLYVHPALAAYNSTANAADKTAQLLLRYIVAPLSSDDESGDDFDVF